MTFLLCKAVKELLVRELAGQGFSTPMADGSEAFTAPNIFLFDPPFKRSHSEPEHYPFVAIRPLEGRDLEARGPSGKDQVNLSLLCAVHSEQSKEAGLMELCNLIFKTRLALLGYRLLGRRFELMPPAAWALAEAEEQEPPFYRGGIEATYTYPMPIPDLNPEEKVEIYGAGYPSGQEA